MSSVKSKKSNSSKLDTTKLAEANKLVTKLENLNLLLNPLLGCVK